jgi:hypothetical protein
MEDTAMKKKFGQVYQFKIALKGIKPPIWRRIQVPETYTFWDLHVAIQDAMGWEDYHLHEFTFTLPITKIKVRIGIPMDDDLGETMLPGWEINISDFFSQESPNGDYCYDFGDGWLHSITLEKILLREVGVVYPRCLDGKRACPPEDCGGIGGYAEFLEAIGDPAHELHEDMLDWVGGEFDPEYFNADEVKFDDPAKRFKMAFG